MAQPKIDIIPPKHVENHLAESCSVYPSFEGICKKFRNLKYMTKFPETYSGRKFVQQVVAQIPWGHNIVLLDKISDIDGRKWYIKKSVENGYRLCKVSWR